MLQKGERAPKGWEEVIRADNKDWQLYKRGFSVWNPSWKLGQRDTLWDLLFYDSFLLPSHPTSRFSALASPVTSSSRAVPSHTYPYMHTYKQIYISTYMHVRIVYVPLYVYMFPLDMRCLLSRTILCTVRPHNAPGKR